MRTFIVKVGPFVYLVPANTKAEAKSKINLPASKTIGVLEVGQMTDSVQGPFDAKLYTEQR